MSDLDAVAAAIRPATAADAPGIRAIRNAAIRDSLAIWTSREQTEAEALAWLTPQITRGTALVAERVDGEILGFAVASAWQAYEGYARTVEDSIYLSPAARGCGLGGRLLATLVEAAQRAGDRTMVAQIEASTTTSGASSRARGLRRRRHYRGRRREARTGPRPRAHVAPSVSDTQRPTGYCARNGAVGLEPPTPSVWQRCIRATLSMPL